MISSYLTPRKAGHTNIWGSVRKRALDRFTSAMATFVSRCRKRDLGMGELAAMRTSHDSVSTAEDLFLDVGSSVYSGYLARLVERGQQDFDGLMWEAVRGLRGGNSRFARDRGREQGDLSRVRFVMIDEFQDFSQMFFGIVAGIRQASPTASFFCVGDDWQAINGFAGAELRYFANFPEYFRDTSQRDIRRNYRSAARVVDVGNALMDGRGPTAIAARPDTGEVWVCEMDRFDASPGELQRHGRDEITPAVLRLVRRFLDQGHEVALLSRRHAVPWFVQYPTAARNGTDGLERFAERLRSFLPDVDHDRLVASTTHGYKGLERPAVIVLDALQGSYPLVHPAWAFLRIFGDSVDQIIEDERRLFYVAVTRAKEVLALVTERRRLSPYLYDIRQHALRLDWGQLRPVASLDGPRVEVRVYRAYEVREQLKDLEYTFNGNGSYWSRVVMADGFSFEALIGEPWAGAELVVKVYSDSGDLLHSWPKS